MDHSTEIQTLQAPPPGLRWRSGKFFIFATVAIGLFVDMALYGLIVPTLPFLLQDRLHIPQSEVQVHIDGLLAAYAGASALSAPLSGWIVDQLPSRRQPFLGGLAALVASTLLLAYGNTIAVLLLARVLQGISGAVVWTLGMSLVMDTVGGENLGKAVGSIFSVASVGSLISPPLGGILYSKTGFTGVLAVALAAIVVDFVMRLLVIEPGAAKRYALPAAESTGDGSENGGANDAEDPTESSPLLARALKGGAYAISPDQPALLRAVPFLCCFRDPAMTTAFFAAFVQALMIGTLDATVPSYAQEAFGFDSFGAGLLFLPASIVDLMTGPISGWAVDKYGTRPVTTFSFILLTPVLACLRLVHGGSHAQLVLYLALLSGSGVALATSSGPVVEAANITRLFHRANPDLFGKNGPYAQMYGFNATVWFAGMALGPLFFGTLKDTIGYGNMNAVLAGVCGISGVICYIFIGRVPKSKSAEN